MSRSKYKLPVINQKIDNNLNKETNITRNSISSKEKKNI